MQLKNNNNQFRNACILILLTCGLWFYDCWATENPVDSLRVLTYNIWSGLDYTGTFRFGSYEDDEERQNRLNIFLTKAKELDPDIILLQEVNPVDKISRKISISLGYNEIHQVCQGGIRVGPFGIPVNLKEGLAILAKPHLKLKLHDIKKLSGSFGIYGDLFSMHFDESIFALVGRVSVSGKTVYVINVHLRSVPPPAANIKKTLNTLRKKKNLSDRHIEEAHHNWERLYKLKMLEVERLICYAQLLAPEVPMILGGDLNLVPSDSLFKEIETQLGLHNTAALRDTFPDFSWDPLINSNTQKSLILPPDSLADLYKYIDILYSRRQRQIDHILFSQQFTTIESSHPLIVLKESQNGVFASDHYGVYTELSIASSKNLPLSHEEKLEALPILSYDTDTGFGYGAKLFLRNFIHKNESFDLIAFNSTQGEKWYRTVISIPDFELRQGTRYPFALDITADFNKWIAYKFYGVGNKSRFDNEKTYTHEVMEISLAANHGVTPLFVLQYGFRHKEINNYNLDLNSSMNVRTIKNHIKYRSFFCNIRYDSRDSFINPSQGTVVQAEIEKSLFFSNFLLWRIWFQYYKQIFYPKTIFAFRLGGQSINGSDLPLQLLLPIGGNNTLRGFTQDRFLDKASLLINSEFRFTIYKRLGGILGLDAGMVNDHIFGVAGQTLHTNYVCGLRYYMDTFIVRLDVGLSDETTGLYLNFGHIF